MIEKNEAFLDHLSTLLEHIDTQSSCDDPSKLFDELERISLDLKHQKHFLTPQPCPMSTPRACPSEQGVIYPASSANFVQKFGEDNLSIFAETGKGLSAKDATFVDHSLNSLSSLHKLQFHFFGKILAQKSDYYVAVAPNFLNPKLAVDFNTFDPKAWKDICRYLNSTRWFVTSSDMDCQWKELPAIQPRHVRA